jgi:hypothetical protein
MDNTGISFINDKDIYTTFGALLISASFENLICRPARKEGAENNMVSHPGVQVFNDNLQPEAQEVELTFLIEGNSLDDYLQKYDSLQDEIDNNSGDGNFSLRVSPLKTVFKLRRKTYLPLDTVTANTGKLIVTVRELNPKDRIKL